MADHVKPLVFLFFSITTLPFLFRYLTNLVPVYSLCDLCWFSCCVLPWALRIQIHVREANEARSLLDKTSEHHGPSESPFIHPVLFFTYSVERVRGI